VNDLYWGAQVRLSAVEVEELARVYAEWSRDSEFKRLLDDAPPRLFSAKGIREWLEKKMETESQTFHMFCIRALSDDRLLGDLTLDVINPGSGEAYVGIAIGGRDSWGKSFGTDALRLLLRYAFTELNLRRVSLTVFEYNPRAIRSYEKAGFQLEGRQRGTIIREGRRWDELHMGILREEWLQAR